MFMKKFIKNYLKIFIAIFLLHVFNTSMATSHIKNDPLEMLQCMANKILVKLKKNHDKIDCGKQIFYTIVNKDIMPYVDIEEIVRWIAGRNVWNGSSIIDKQMFIKEFKVLMINTYATILKNYANKKTKFFPLRGDWEKKKRVKVNSQVIDNINQIIKIDYKLIHRDTSWKIYDIVVEGVSFLKGYQAQFSDKIKKDGLRHVMYIIAHHNKKRN